MPYRSSPLPDDATNKACKIPPGKDIHDFRFARDSEQSYLGVALPLKLPHELLRPCWKSSPPSRPPTIDTQ
jgi:hypothetical protein